MASEPKDIEAHTASTPVSDTANLEDLKNTEFEQRNVGTLDRKLKSRHIQFLALSGAIGTGLFVGSGQVLSLAGPLSAFLAYAITGFNLVRRLLPSRIQS
jgi:amino acid transporter